MLHKLFPKALSPMAGSDHQHCAERRVVPKEIVSQQSDGILVFQDHVALLCMELIVKLRFRQVGVKPIPKFLIPWLDVSDLYHSAYLPKF